ncbi:Transposase [Cordylochernes scorpioides]|uniref:Transposase n=1 Tax=Cordylochernes scorpioides TaxID=51811 RepID=A0ABY6KR77_9ARAC|nr:Transposase [Cordylochernes scorpioides]
MNLGKDAQNVQKITDLIKENPRTTLLELEQDTGISKTTIGRIVTKDLKLKKTPAKFIPRFLTNEQKLCRLATCENMLEMTRTDSEWKDKIITGDETWVYDYDPETKRQHAEWRGQDIAPNDFFLFPKLKAVLKGRHFDTRDDIIEKSLLALKSIPKELYKNCFDNLGNDGAVAAPQATCTAILQHVQDTLDHSISTRTISRRLVANGLHSCRPLRRLPLTPPNRRQRLEWCRARSTWMTEWHRVVFSDESRFCLSSDSRRVRVWRRRGERSNPAAIVERPTVRQRGIMVWGAIAYDSRSPLLRIQGTMTAQRYVDDVLRPVTLPYLQGVPNALYQQDNARPHTARISQQALQDVQMLPWPPYSPDLSPIEHVWDIIGRRLHALPQPRSEDELWQMVEREWRVIPQDAIRTLIDSLPRRVAACIAVRGGPTCY